MERDELLILTGGEVLDLLDGRELAVVEAVAAAYRAHRRGESSLPHSVFLRFPDQPRDRIIGLPAYLGDDFSVAGLKWIASFPGNTDRGLDRASAVLILNSTETGVPRAILESSVISARRTAASAALAARELHRSGRAGEGEDLSVGLVGTGLINFEILRFLRAVFPALARVSVYDIAAPRAGHFGVRAAEAFDGLEVRPAAGLEALLADHELVSFATTALEPTVDLAPCRPGSTILHISLRDLVPESLLGADNVVDDPDHVCRAQTSVHLLEQKTGGRAFLRCTLADVLLGEAPPRASEDAVTVFSPFGLGVLDLAVGQLAVEQAEASGVGTRLPSFLPPPAAPAPVEATAGAGAA